MLLRTVGTTPKAGAAGLTALLIALTMPALAPAHPARTVAPGETLWSIARDSKVTVSALAAANGVSETAGVFAGQTIRIPSEETPTSGPPAAGAYTVRVGDTLIAIAARSGLSVEQLAWMNGLRPDGRLLAGTALKLPSGAEPTLAPSPPPTQLTSAPPHPTNERVDASFVQQVALAHDVPPALAAAIAEQESGFNNAMVSPSNARGVMQILPGTWQFIQSSLAGGPLAPAAASDNVHAGVLYLRQLLTDTGGDAVLATAAYYQGLASVRKDGLLAVTQAYVADVMALRSRYGG